MSDRITPTFIKRRFELWAKDFGLSTECWKTSDDLKRQIAQIGSVALDHNSVYGGYQVIMIVNDGGAEKTLNGGRMKAVEMLAWFEGCAWAAKAR